MTAPNNYLAPALPADLITELILFLDLPRPTLVEPLQVSAAFHTIYLIHFNPDTAASIPARREPDGSVILVLRVSGRQLPTIKTLNEVGVMTWVRQNTHIPVPAVVRYSATEDNPIGHEFTLLEKAAGVSVEKVYPTLSTESKTKMVEQLTNYLIELHSHPWTDGYVGGLTIRDGEIASGPPIEETYWQAPDITTYWEDKETLESLNPFKSDGYASYTAYNVACLERYIHAMEVHPSLAAHRDRIPRLRQLIAALESPEHKEELNRVSYVLAHKDLHFANIMCDPTDPECPITAVLDWEFSSVVPAPRWNPVRAFAWNYRYAPEDKAERNHLEEVFADICRAKGADHVLDEMKLNGRQEAMQKAVNHVRAIVEVSPRGQATEEKMSQWWATVEEGMAVLGV
ncbi:hypothetical protein BO78DRAFT_326098 [Aspergillus sclerotiicarbonarius CBS 121057]|uniref:Aminoglycoside phosphotransferase domain-containing protein n=1 Tax=Aspergillus sclerotiicarbonarius (strain CBS 121057 / IBT 28362) TaxID=1448318 RepID=A0A319E624_ASPSB|nr:hypothetical protein BO78DRAFT_326098 [Aspergillus sclerotiicarbonarius CBS 121057]